CNSRIFEACDIDATALLDEARQLRLASRTAMKAVKLAPILRNCRNAYRYDFRLLAAMNKYTPSEPNVVRNHRDSRRAERDSLVSRRKPGWHVDIDFARLPLIGRRSNELSDDTSPFLLSLESLGDERPTRQQHHCQRS